MTAVKQHLTHLETTGLIRLAQVEPELEYLFRHALVQDAAYRSLLRQDRKRMHLVVGETLEHLYPDRREEFAPLLAYHFDLAGESERALEYFITAGDTAAGVYAISEAINHYGRGVELAQGVNAKADIFVHLCMRLGRVLELDAQFEQALAHYEEMEKLSHQLDDHSLELAALMGRANLRNTLSPVHNPELGQALSEQALALAQHIGDRKAEVEILWNQINFYSFTGRSFEAIAWGERALALAREQGLREQLALILNDISYCYNYVGQLHQAYATRTEALTLWRELDNLPMLTDNLTGFGSLCHSLGEHERALELLKEAFAICQSIENIWGQAYSLVVMGPVHWELGQPDQAMMVLKKSIQLSQQIGFVPAPIYAYAYLATMLGGLGAIAQGLKSAHQALTRAEQMPLFRMVALGALARLQLLNGDLKSAQETITQGETDPHREQIPIFYLPIQVVAIELALRKEEHQRALEMAEALLGNLEQTGARMHVPRTLFLKAQALSALDQDGAARETLRDAYSVADEMNARTILWQIAFALSQLELDPARVETLRQSVREIVAYIAERTPTELKATFLETVNAQTGLEVI